jgi:dTDP-4-amino-4,6-dideoxygalactose transaminase
LTSSTNPPVPFLDLATHHRELETDLVAAFRRALASSQFVGGPEVEEFEREFAAFCGTTQCVGLNSGTDALRCAYIALGVRPGDEIITVSHTFIATTEAISQAGGTIRFVDIDPVTMTIDPGAVAAAVGPRTVGIVPVHLYGQPAALAPVLETAARHGLWVVEDAAQAHGALYGDRTVGSIGTMGCFSFYPGKNLGSLGEGGAVIGNDDRLVEIVRQQREHGQTSKYVHETEGYNGRLHAIQAAFLRIKLRRLPTWNAARRRVASAYRQALQGVGDLQLPPEVENTQPVFHLFVVRTSRRDEMRQYLTTQGIGTGLHYPCPLHLQRAYASLGLRRGSLPVTEAVAETCLSLPIYPEMTEAQVAQVAGAVRSFFTGH